MKFNAKVGGNSRRVKFEDGKPVVGLLRGEPREFWVIWPEGGAPKEVEEGTPDARFRFEINMVVSENNVLVPKILDGSGYMYKSLRELSNDYDLSRYTIKITKTGKGQSTKYSVIPMPKGEVTDATLDKINRDFPLFELGGKRDESGVVGAGFGVDAEVPTDESGFDGDGDVPF